MDLSTTIVFYLLAGAGTSFTVFVTTAGSAATRIFPLISALLFWPLFLPLLASRGPADDAGAGDHTNPDPQQTNMAKQLSAAIEQVESELDVALSGLSNWLDQPPSFHPGEIELVKDAWRSQAERIVELDRLLVQPGFALSTDDGSTGDLVLASDADELRQANIRQLRQVRQQLHSNLMGTLAWVRELVTMLHLARYTEAPPSRAAELVSQIAAASEGLATDEEAAELTRKREPVAAW